MLCQYKLLRDQLDGNENTTETLSSCQKVIPRCYIIIETANKILNKHVKSVMLDFLSNCRDLCQ